MTDTDTVRALRAAFAEQTRDHHLDPAIGIDAADRLGRRRPAAHHLAVAAALVCVLAVAVGYALARGRTQHRASPAAASCVGAISTTPLPPWARAGFTPPDTAVAHVTSEHGRIVAILFVTPLRVHQPAGTFNKVLWVARDGGVAPLVIRAEHAGRSGVTRTVAGGPGPSYLDLPAAGCWHLTLTWGDQHDTLSMPYAR